MAWARMGVLPGPRGGPPTFCLLILEYRVEAPSGRRGCSADRGTGWTQGTGDGQPAGCPPQTCRLPPEASARRGELLPSRPQVSAANMYVLVNFILIFGCFPFTPFLFSNTLSPTASVRKAQGT